ncbi:astacin-like metalloendopeptidase isoform X1 [Syngnathus scovelli]|uniref:astacin-like metalloendopeptidase isoform X1 n=1 Tax=Syngnathus scovelli TaxID=161590 RepID=UPI00210F83A2|nr:astacin-like metalloendopeptidase isoform X1 [Syngnathus scovelli]
MLLLFAALFCSASLPRAGRCVPLPLQDPDLVAKALEYTENNPETLAGLMDDAVAEGDMLLPDYRNAANRPWPSRHIPYRIDYELGYRSNDIDAALKMVTFHTCLSFHQRTSEADYLFFKSGFGCASYVGFMGGKQEVHVGATCKVGNIVHEVLHALGFFHEHTRLDRGKYINILSGNIMQGHHKNFEIQPGETFQLPYDLPSIMHYGSNFFSANGQPTIVAKVRDDNMGQRVAMTHTDVQRVRLLYNCDRVGNVAEPTPAAIFSAHIYDFVGLPRNTTLSPLRGARKRSSTVSDV